MLFRKALARVGAVVVFASSAAALAGAPAQAAGTETDLELSVVGTRVAAGVEGKVASAKITNKGENTPRELTITADLSGLDTDKVIAVPAADCEVSDPPAYLVTCEIDEADIPGPGRTLDLPVVVVREEGAVGPYSGSVPFSISSPDDTNPDNNTQVVEIMLSDESGVDLGVDVPDVTEKIDLLSGDELGPLRAGDTTATVGLVFNWGDMIASGIKVSLKLPEHVTFAETEADCEYGPDNRTATCTYTDLILMPVGDGEGDFIAVFYWPVMVDGGVEEPVTLPDGSWTVEALGEAPVDSPLARRAGAKLPDHVEMVSAQEAGLTDIDESDNVDTFAVVVSADEGGSGGGLPVTGAQAGLLGGVGATVIVVGVLMFLAARRRRIILVTPGDEKPSA